MSEEHPLLTREELTEMAHRNLRLADTSPSVQQMSAHAAVSRQAAYLLTTVPAPQPPPSREWLHPQPGA